MQRNNEKTTGQAGVVRKTAREFVEQFIPGLVYVYEDIETALAEETERASKIAAECEIEDDPGGRYPDAVWFQIFP